MARVWRDGQKKQCFIYRLISVRAYGKAGLISRHFLRLDGHTRGEDLPTASAQESVEQLRRRSGGGRRTTFHRRRTTRSLSNQ